MSFQTMNNPTMSQKSSSRSPRQRLTPSKEKEPKNYNIKSKRPLRQPTPYEYFKIKKKKLKNFFYMCVVLPPM